MRHTFLVFFIIFCTLCATTKAQNANPLADRWHYIETYRDLAIEQMQRYRIPASITLAQGLFESNAGKSELARRYNNHFGIKKGVNWNGPTVMMRDDAPNDLFRVYSSPRASYEDHSLFLRNNRRYAILFTYRINDYRNWAHGLKRCGYATDPQYAQKIIDVIEKYNLSQFDSYTSGRYHAKTRTTVEEERLSEFFRTHIVYLNNRCYMIVAQEGDTWESIARETGTKPWKLLTYNDYPMDYTLHKGDLVYLQKKRNKADKFYKGKPHTIQAGESLHSISQRYGIRLSRLYKLNGLSPDATVGVGDRLRVR
ncbi:MAG: glucosaminidase domain-containing protein [Bacteroidaceae bacterium]|nr:glucosaminidase domain-containing protein [Bacteroidaceae bacterium]